MQHCALNGISHFMYYFPLFFDMSLFGWGISWLVSDISQGSGLAGILIINVKMDYDQILC